MDGLPRLDDAAGRGPRTWPLTVRVAEFGKFRRHADHCLRAHEPLFNTKQDAKLASQMRTAFSSMA